jgi:hypothetical protein
MKQNMYYMYGNIKRVVKINGSEEDNEQAGDNDTGN